MSDANGYRKWPDAQIEAYITRWEGEVDTQSNDDLIQLLDDMEQELADREEFRSESQAAYDDQYTSLADRGLELGSYET